MSMNYNSKNIEIGKANALHGKNFSWIQLENGHGNAEVETIFLLQQKIT